jgi:hypothetical protein
MKLNKIIGIAKTMGIEKTSQMKEKELINAIQMKEGNQPCFGIGKKTCEENGCCWKENCLK